MPVKIMIFLFLLGCAQGPNDIEGTAYFEVSFPGSRTNTDRNFVIGTPKGASEIDAHPRIPQREKKTKHPDSIYQ